MQTEPPPFIWAVPDEKNILTCEQSAQFFRYCADDAFRELSNSKLILSCSPQVSNGVQRGPPDSPFAGGEYHGVLLFPSEYPFKPPGIKVRSDDTLVQLSC